MNELINGLIGKRVQVETVYGEGRVTDNGILRGYDHPWLNLAKDNGETLYFSVYRIRLIKELP